MADDDVVLEGGFLADEPAPSEAGVLARVDKARAALEQLAAQPNECCTKGCCSKLLAGWDMTSVLVRSAALRTKDEIRTAVAMLGSHSLKNWGGKRPAFAYRLPVVGEVCLTVYAAVIGLPPRVVSRLITRAADAKAFTFFKPLSHGLTDKTSNRALLETTKAAFVEFVLKLVEDTAEMDPARRFRKAVASNDKVYCYLPSSFTHKEIQARFDEWIKKDRFEVYQAEVTRRKTGGGGIDRSHDWSSWPMVCSLPPTIKIFEEHKALAHVKIRSPSSELCESCAAPVGHQGINAQRAGEAPTDRTDTQMSSILVTPEGTPVRKKRRR